MSVVDKIQLRRNGPFYDIRDNSKSPLDHTHDDRYYTESEVNNFLAEKASLVHNHDDRYYTESEVDSMGSDIYNAINSKLPLSGGTITGNLTVDGSIAFPGVKRTAIPGNSDLNDYYQSGHFSCEQTEIARTLASCPATTAFRLDVYSGVGAEPIITLKNYLYITQHLETFTGEIWERRGQTRTTTVVTWDPRWERKDIRDDRYYTESEIDAQIAVVQAGFDQVTATFGDVYGQLGLKTNSNFEDVYYTSFPTTASSTKFIRLRSAVTVGSVQIPAYTIGAIIGNINAIGAAFVGIHYSGYIYIAYRDGTNWTGAKRIG